LQRNPLDPADTADTEVPVYDRGTGRSPWRDRLLAGVLCLVVGAAGGFALGRATASGPSTLAEAIQLAQEGKLPQGDLQGRLGGQGFPGGQNQGGGGQGGQPGQGGGPSVQGEITTVSGDVLTVSTGAGELRVQLTGSTEIRRAVAGTAGDLAVGDTISVRIDPGASNSSDGTVSASSVTEEPAQ
jgi:hypothetical protein